MKKIFVLAVFVFTLLLQGCGEKGDIYSEEDFWLYNDDGRVLKLGMTEEEFKDVMGEPEKIIVPNDTPEDLFFVYENNTLAISHYNAEDRIFYLSSEDGQSWHNSKNIRAGISTFGDVIKAYNLDMEKEDIYGGSGVGSIGGDILLYFIVNSRGEIERLKHPTEESGKEFELDYLYDSYYEITFRTSEMLYNDKNVVEESIISEYSPNQYMAVNKNGAP